MQVRVPLRSVAIIGKSRWHKTGTAKLTVLELPAGPSVKLMTAAWSKGHNGKYPYYFCHSKGCNDYRKSIRKEKIEDEFEALLLKLWSSACAFRSNFSNRYGVSRKPAETMGF